MPLDPAGLESSLESLFSEPPATAAECAQAWADAMNAYAADIVPPSTTIAAAAASLVGALQSAFESPSAAAGVDAAFAAFATSVGGGMLPTFTGTPPSEPLNVASFLGTSRSTHAQAAADFATLVDAWMKTGIATLVAPPNTPQPWA